MSKEIWQNLSLLGIGALLSTIINVGVSFRTKKIELQSSREAWLRDHRLEAFSHLCKVVISLRKIDNDGKLKIIKASDEIMFLASDALLLIDDAILKKKIYKFIDDYAEFVDLVEQIIDEEKSSSTHSNKRDQAQRQLNKIDKSGKSIAAQLTQLIVNE